MFKVGDFVKVKGGIMDADEGKYDIGGWQGHITDIQEKEHPDVETIFEVHWDSQTLKSMPNGYIQKTFGEYAYLESYFVGESDITMAMASETLEVSKTFAKEFEEDNIFNDGTPEGEIIMAVMNGKEDEIEGYHKWLHYFETHLTFPFFAKVIESESRLIKIGEKISIISLDSKLDDDGIVANIKWRGQQKQFSLYDLEAMDKKSNNYVCLLAYSEWHMNV